MSDFHNRMMRIQVRDADLIAQSGNLPGYAYKVGYRDARHAAAELANEADRLIEAQEEALEAAREVIKRLQHYVPYSPAACQGMRCRVRWCESCCDDEVVNAELHDARRVGTEANATIAQIEAVQKGGEG